MISLVFVLSNTDFDPMIHTFEYFGVSCLAAICSTAFDGFFFVDGLK